MCGLAGFIDLSGGRASDELHMTARRMAGTLRHRGPDDAGTWVDADARIALGHQRLAILDLSSQGHQPMRSACGRFMLIFNGEIYNFATLRRDLEQLGQRFRGHSDTEAMLAAISQWGLEAALTRFNGMFAFALWDRRERVLHLGRDRLGEKPLYYGWMGKTFIFASELKALSAHPQFHGEIDRDVLALYFRYNYVPTPFSIYHDVYKLPPGCLLTVSALTAEQRASFSPFPEEQASSWRPVRYWSAKQVAERGTQNPFRGSARDAVECLEALLSDAVRLRMIADVPVGSFLSGGIDSSTVVAIMQAMSGRPIKTFSIGSHDGEYDEAGAAKAMAKHIGTDHVDLYASWNDAIRVLPTLPTLYDEPFSDSSQIPTFLIARLARRDVTVCLSGDGGDELFAGYNLYFRAQRIWNYTRRMPSVLRCAVARALTTVPPQMWDSAFAKLAAFLPAKLRQREPGDKLHKLAELLPAETPNALYNMLMSRWRDPMAMVVNSREPRTMLTSPGCEPELSSFVQRMMYFDLMTYLPDDILVKVDRASMGVGLEVRIPLLDYRIVEFAWQIPLSMKIRSGQGKWLLRQVLHRYVPEHLVNRRKMGFSVPISPWLRGPMREWAEALLSDKRIRDDGYLNPQLIHRKWSEHLSGVRNWSRELWEVLMFQAWLENARRI
jgi:asparagine synthase (glutamine-hydrolysing)